MTFFPGATNAEVDALDARLDALEAGGSGGVMRVFNVKDPAYGAVGNGTANDYPAIQAAYNAAIAAGGGIVYLPPGTYYLNTSATGIQMTVAVGTGAPPPQVPFKGAGKAATTIKLSNNCRCFLNVVGTTGQTVWIGNFAVEDLTARTGAHEANSGMRSASGWMSI
jgi:hypothetical protein